MALPLDGSIQHNMAVRALIFTRRALFLDLVRNPGLCGLAIVGRLPSFDPLFPGTTSQLMIFCSHYGQIIQPATSTASTTTLYAHQN